MPDLNKALSNIWSIDLEELCFQTEKHMKITNSFNGNCGHPQEEGDEGGGGEE